MTTDASTKSQSALDDRALPWIIAHQVAEGSPLRQALESLGGTVVFVNQLRDVRQADFNLLVAEGTLLLDVEPHIDVLNFDLPALSRQQPDYRGRSVTLWFVPGDRAARFQVGQHARGLGLEELVKTSLLANLVPSSDYRVLKEHTSADGALFEPFAEETDGKALAGMRVNSDGSEWWMLPPEVDAESHPKWLQAALTHWRQRRPNLFPADGYGRPERWMTYDELLAAQAVAEHEEETESYLQERERQLQALLTTAEAASVAAATKERRLIEGTGDGLVEAVMDALVRIGFNVKDSDKEAEANKAAKREDLQVTLASQPGWVALVEIKGYEKRSAKANDLMQLAKAAGFYEGKHGREVDAQWYVVNPNYATPPDARPVPLGSSPEDVEKFAALGGAVIDTRELFQLLRNLQLGVTSAVEAQESLTAATHIYTAPMRGQLQDEDNPA